MLYDPSPSPMNCVTHWVVYLDVISRNRDSIHMPTGWVRILSELVTIELLTAESGRTEMVRNDLRTGHKRGSWSRRRNSRNKRPGAYLAWWSKPSLCKIRNTICQNRSSGTDVETIAEIETRRRMKGGTEDDGLVKKSEGRWAIDGK